MRPKETYRHRYFWLVMGLVFCFFISISLGSVAIPVGDVLRILFGSTEQDTWAHIIIYYRLPKTLTAILVGSGLGLSGLMMQTLFRNPLAGPFVLGITSGASLGVAILLLGGSVSGGLLAGILVSKWSLVIASSLGSFLVLLAVVLVSARVRDTMAILIIGLMFGSVTAAVVSILSYFGSADQLQQFVFWGFGSLGHLSWVELGILFLVYLIGLLLCTISIKALNALLLGENYAKSMGINLQISRLIIIVSTSLLAGGITAFAGPIAFIGLAVPHLVRQLFKTSDQKTLIIGVFLMGAIVMLVCDTIAQIPYSAHTLPINAITSIIGAPVVIWLLVRMRRMVF